MYTVYTIFNLNACHFFIIGFVDMTNVSNEYFTMAQRQTVLIPLQKQNV